MATEKLNQSLDEILKNEKGATRAKGRPTRSRGRKQTASAAKAPVGGVKKNTKPVKAVKPTPTGPAAGAGTSKIIVNNLPVDVGESQIQEYFQKSIGSVRSVTLTYGPDGRSRGTATIVFGKAGNAVQAAKEMNGVKVDNRPLRVEVVYSAQDAPVVTPKSLADRMSGVKKEKAQPKPATAAKTGKAGKAGKAGVGKKGRGGRAGGNRLPKKTAEELDAEMADYFQPDVDAMQTNGAAPQAAGDGDDEML